MLIEVVAVKKHDAAKAREGLAKLAETCETAGLTW